MCGLVGVAGDIRQAEKKMFRDMLIFDQVRGFDSTGIASVALGTRPEGPSVYKEVGPAQNIWDFDGTKSFDHRGVLSGSSKVLIGHNRAATIGKVTADNAHPFKFGNITGAHNGSLTLWDDLLDAHKFTVDSKAIFNDIDGNGIDHTWKNFRGAAALSYWNEKEQTLNLIRNSQRPLYTIRSRDEKTLFWASEWEMIWLAARRNGVKLFLEEGKTNEIFHQLPEEVLHTYKPTSLDIPLEETRKLEKKSYVVYKTKGTTTPKVKPRNATKLVELDAKTFYEKGEWKEGTKRSDLEVGGITLQDFRSVRRVGFGIGGGDDLIYRLSLVSKGKYLGTLNVYPTNLREAFHLKLVEGRLADVKSKVEYTFTLLGKPREDSSGVARNFSCAASLLKDVCTVVDKSHEEPVGEKKWEGDSNLAAKLASTQESTETKHYLDSRGYKVTKKEFEKILRDAKDCCAYCQDSLVPEDHDTLFWMNEQSPICGSCQEKWSGDMHVLQGAFY